jgi:glycosyltransferase involved in cell wall biosynthesis
MPSPVIEPRARAAAAAAVKAPAAETSAAGAPMKSPLPSYVLITPARNEAAYIELTLQSMVAQTVLPLKWVIVSDGSTDATDEIVGKYTSGHPWIELVRMPERRERNFAGKVYSFNAGYERVKQLPYDVIANLDADVSFEPGYFEFLMGKLAANPKLGVVGTPFREGDFQYDFRIVSQEHVSGQIQVFRRTCFEDIGGYRPLRTGGVDLTAVITARMKGWQTRTFLEKPYEHHRKMSSANHSLLASAYNGGRVDYLLGCDPLWIVFRSGYRMLKHKPVVINGALCLAGFTWAMLTRAEKSIPAEVVKFRRREERRRLRDLIKKALTGRAARPQPHAG